MRPSKAPTWIPSEDQILTEELARGVPIGKLAESLPGRSESAIQRRNYNKARATSASVGRKNWTSEEVQQLADLHWKGLKYTEIALKLIRGHGSIDGKLTRTGLKDTLGPEVAHQHTKRSLEGAHSQSKTDNGQ